MTTSAAQTDRQVLRIAQTGYARSDVPHACSTVVLIEQTMASVRQLCERRLLRDKFDCDAPDQPYLPRHSPR